MQKIHCWRIIITTNITTTTITIITIIICSVWCASSRYIKKAIFVTFLFAFHSGVKLGWRANNSPLVFKRASCLSWRALQTAPGAPPPLWLPVIATMRAGAPELLWSIKSSSAISPDDSPSFHPLNVLFHQTRTVSCVRVCVCAGLRHTSLWTEANRSVMEVELDSGGKKGELRESLPPAPAVWWPLRAEDYCSPRPRAAPTMTTHSNKDINIFRGLLFFNRLNSLLLPCGQNCVFNEIIPFR